MNKEHNWMKFTLKTIYNEEIVVMYDSNRYPSDKEDELRKAIDLADVYRNSYYDDSGVIVMDKKTADFWFSIVEEVKCKALEKYKNDINK